MLPNLLKNHHPLPVALLGPWGGPTSLLKRPTQTQAVALKLPGPTAREWSEGAVNGTLDALMPGVYQAESQNPERPSPTQCKPGSGGLTGLSLLSAFCALLSLEDAAGWHDTRPGMRDSI